MWFFVSKAKTASQSDKIVQMRASAHVDSHSSGIENFELKQHDVSYPPAESKSIRITKKSHVSTRGSNEAEKTTAIMIWQDIAGNGG